MIWHQNICADPGAEVRALLRKLNKGRVDFWPREKLLPFGSAGGREINWGAYMEAFETREAPGHSE